MNLLEQPIESDISGLQDSQSLSPECTITFQKYVVMRMDEFLDSYPLPTNMNEVERQSTGKNFHFLRSINPTNIKTEVSDSLDCANSFWNLPDINSQLTKFTDNWAYERKFNSRYLFGFVDCLLEFMWIQDRMFASKNMNAHS